MKPKAREDRRNQRHEAKYAHVLLTDKLPKKRAKIRKKARDR